MSVSVLLVTHDRCGEILLNTVIKTFGNLPLPAKTLMVDTMQDPDECKYKLNQLLNFMDQGDGVLILSDLFGATPCNVASSILNQTDVNVRLVCGLNLPMLIRIMNYPQLSLDALAEKAYSGGRDGILAYQKQTAPDAVL